MKRVDNSSKCGKSLCRGGLPCLLHNGYGSSCKDCLCRKCVYGNCFDDDGTVAFPEVPWWKD